MFYGAQIKPGESVCPSLKDGGEILHISQICLFDPKDNGKTYVQIDNGKGSYCVAALKKDVCENVSVDLFLSTNTGMKISTKGAKNEVHIVGYFEPEDGDDDDDMSDGSFGEELPFPSRKTGTTIEELNDDDDDDEDDETNLGDKLNSEDELDDEDEDEDEGDEDEDDDDDLNEDEEDIIEKKPKVPQNKAALKAGATAAKNKQSSVNDQKRKAQVSEGSVDAKKQKVSGDSLKVANDKFQVDLVKFLTANGRTNLGSLGQKVKKPSEVQEKLGQFIKERPNVFKMENGFVSLSK